MFLKRPPDSIFLFVHDQDECDRKCGMNGLYSSGRVNVGCACGECETVTVPSEMQ